MSIDRDESERLATLLDAGRIMEANDHVASRNLVPELQNLFDQLDPELIKARGLNRFLEVEKSFFV